MASAMRADIRKKIMVACAFDDRLDGVLQAATELAKRWSADLHLIHVCDPWNKGILSSTMETGPIEMLDQVTDVVQKDARQRLDILRTSLPKAINVEVEVARGDVVDTLCDKAQDQLVNLLIIGGRKQTWDPSQLGFSSTVGVLAASHVPVMVIGERNPLNFQTDKLRMIVADDFDETGAAAVAFAANFAGEMSACDVVHTHVVDKKAKNPQTGSRQEIAGKMQERFGAAAGSIESRGDFYLPEVAHGSPATEIERSAAAARADIAVFGQHRLIHRNMMHVGQVPFKAMLGQKRAIIVAPTKEPKN